MSEQAPRRERAGDFGSVVRLGAIITGVVFEKPGVGCEGSLRRRAERLDDVIGENGKKLCAVDGTERDGEVLPVRTGETVRSAGKVDGSDRRGTYTLGVVRGALGRVLDRHLGGVHTESVLRGGTRDVFRFEDR